MLTKQITEQVYRVSGFKPTQEYYDKNQEDYNKKQVIIGDVIKELLSSKNHITDKIVEHKLSEKDFYDNKSKKGGKRKTIKRLSKMKRLSKKSKSYKKWNIFS